MELQYQYIGTLNVDLPTIDLRNIPNGYIFESDIAIYSPFIGLVLEIRGGNFVVNSTNQANNFNGLQGLSADTKPTTGVPSGSSFYELDTEKAWIYDAYNINAATGNGWWTC